MLDAGFTAPYLSAEAPVPPVDAPAVPPREVSPEGRVTGGAAPVNTPEATPRAAWNGCIKLVWNGFTAFSFSLNMNDSDTRSWIS